MFIFLKLFFVPRDNVHSISYSEGQYGNTKSPPGLLPRYDHPRKLETYPVGCF